MPGVSQHLADLSCHKFSETDAQPPFVSIPLFSIRVGESCDLAYSRWSDIFPPLYAHVAINFSSLDSSLRLAGDF